MTARETSIEVYHRMEVDGLLSPRRWEIWKVLFHQGPLTANEIFRVVYGNSSINQANVPARLNEMREMGCVKEAGERACSVTGNTVILWDVTAKLPQKERADADPTRDDIIRVLGRELKTVVIAMRELQQTKGTLSKAWSDWLPGAEAALIVAGRHLKRKKRKDAH